MRPTVCLGEVLVELSPDGQGGFRLGYAGDTFNTAVHLARLGVPCGYATGLGAADPFSDAIVARLAAEGVEAGLVYRFGPKLPGLYLVELDGAGERRFHYWRGESPARSLFDAPGRAEALVAGLKRFRRLYLSGVSLAVIGGRGRARLLAALPGLKRAGLELVLDLNLRLRLWGEAAGAREALKPWLAAADRLFASGEDAEALLGPGDGLAQLRALATQAEIAFRPGDLTVVLAAGGKAERLDLGPPGPVVDASGAGDAFNAAYLAARDRGEPPEAAARAGHALASQVVQARGALPARAPV